MNEFSFQNSAHWSFLHNASVSVEKKNALITFQKIGKSYA